MKILKVYNLLKYKQHIINENIVKQISISSHKSSTNQYNNIQAQIKVVTFTEDTIEYLFYGLERPAMGSFEVGVLKA